MYIYSLLSFVSNLILPIIFIYFLLKHGHRINTLENDIALLKKNDAPSVTASEQKVDRPQDVSQNSVQNISQVIPQNQTQSIPKEAYTPPKAVASTDDSSGKILGRIGIVAVLIGVAFFLRYAFANNWIGPAGRVMIGIMFGIGFIGLGQYLRAKYLQYSDLLMGGGIVILYFSVFSAHSFYGLIDSGMTGVFMFLVTLLSFTISITNSTQTLALVSVIGAFATPAMVGSNENAMWSLFGYLTIINVGVLGVSFFRKWPRLNLASFIGTAINFLAWYLNYYEPIVLGPTLIFCIATFIIFLVAQIARAMVANTKADEADYLLMGAGAFSLSFMGYQILNPEYHNVLGFASVVVAVIYMAFAFMVNKSNPEDKALNIFLPGLAVVFLSIAVPMQFSGAWIAVAWFIEACALYFIASIIANRGFQIMGIIVYALGLLDFIIWYENNYRESISSFVPFFNVAFAIFLVSIFAAYFIAHIYNKYGSTDLEIRKRGITVFIIIANVLSVWSLSAQITSYYVSKQAQLYSSYESSRVQSSTYSNGYDTSSQQQIDSQNYYSKIDSNRNVSNTLVSILWAVYAMILTTIGFVGRLVGLRRLGLALFIITALKVLIDVWSLGELYRIISFITFGIIALIASFGYIKYKDRVKEIIVILLFIGISATSYSTAYAAFNPVDWQYSRIINTQSASNFVKASLPTDISWVSNKGNGFGDIRIIDGQGNEVPYLLSTDQEFSSPTISPKILSLSSLADGSTSFVADMNKAGLVYGTLEINTGNRTQNFRRQVSIYASDLLLPITDSRWSKVTSDGFIFKITDPNTGSVSGKSTVNFPVNTSRYLKVVIGSGSEGAIDVSSVNTYSDVQVLNKVESTLLSATVNNDVNKKTTDITIDLGSVGRLSNGVEINIADSDKNYIRRVVIETSDDLVSWRNIGGGSISKVSTSIFNGKSNTISYGQVRSRYIRLSIVNDDNPPLNVINSVIVKSPVLSLIFQSNPSSQYVLYYGNPIVDRPQYDIVSLSSYIDKNNLTEVSLGSEISNPRYIAPAGPVIPFTEKYKILLNISLVVLAILLCVGIAWYLKDYMKGERKSF
jgi:hypothetical protein